VVNEQRIRKAHILRLEVASSNFPRFDRNMNTGEEQATTRKSVPATNTFITTQPIPRRSSSLSCRTNELRYMFSDLLYAKHRPFSGPTSDPRDLLSTWVCLPLQKTMAFHDWRAVIRTGV